jgi:hypothetical protein
MDEISEVTIPDGVAPTLEMMLRLHPDTRQVAVISGDGPRDRQMADVFRQEMTTFGNRVAFAWLTDLSMEFVPPERNASPHSIRTARCGSSHGPVNLSIWQSQDRSNCTGAH